MSGITWGSNDAAKIDDTPAGWLAWLTDDLDNPSRTNGFVCETGERDFRGHPMFAPNDEVVMLYRQLLPHIGKTIRIRGRDGILELLRVNGCGFRPELRWAGFRLQKRLDLLRSLRQKISSIDREPSPIA